jgi:hypothetical protein
VQILILPLDHLCFLLLFQHDFLQFFPIVVKLTAFVFYDLGFFLNLNYSGLKLSYFVANEFLRLLFLLGELALQGRYFALVCHVVLDYRFSHRIKRKGRPSRTIKLVCVACCWDAQFCLRGASHLSALIKPTHARAFVHKFEIISWIASFSIETRTAWETVFVKLRIFLDNFYIRSVEVIGFVQICALDNWLWNLLAGRLSPRSVAASRA